MIDPNYARKVTDAALFAIDAIKRQRMKGIISDKDVCDLLGYSKGTLTAWRNWDRTITVEQMGSLIKEFNLDGNFFLKQEGSPWGEAELMVNIRSLEKRMEIVEGKVGIETQKKGK